MGNTGGTGGVGGEFGGGGGGGGGGGFNGGNGGQGGNGYQLENKDVYAADMNDSDDTVFIRMKGFVDGHTFIENAKKAGKIKTHTDTAVRMAQIRKTEDMTEGIVTYEDVQSVKRIQQGEFNIHGTEVIPARNYLEKLDMSKCYLTRQKGENKAWSYWRWQSEKHQPRGGQGGRGGSSLFGGSRGQDGEPGGPGGQGGRGGRGGVGRL